jgi:hypothetical protein
MQPDAASLHLDRARAAIREAMAQWDPADLERVESSREMLLGAVSDMRIFESAVIAGDVPASHELCNIILAAQKEIVHATRVVDACVAFHRGLAARTGGAPPVYDSGGRIAGESAGMEPEVHA